MAEEERPKTWLEEAIEREALPAEAREETTTAFCERWKIPQSTYFYNISKRENQEVIVGLAMNNAKKYAPEVLDNLGERAKNDNKATEMYLKFILALAEKADITTGGEKIQLNDKVAALAKKYEKELKEAIESTE